MQLLMWEGGETMIPAWKTYWSIFWRTFTVLAAAIFATAQGWDWFSDGAAVANVQNAGWLLLGAVLGGLVAAGWAYVNTPAVTPVEKATRSAIQALLGSAFATVAITNASDVVGLQDMIVPTLAAVVLAFLLTFFNNQGGVPQPSDLAFAVPVNRYRDSS
jgi:hypothetical protein